MQNEDKRSLLSTLSEPVTNAARNITDKPTQNIGTTFADIWYLVFGSISQTADKRRLKYFYALQELENELKEKVSKIPENKRTEPDMQTTAPALEAAKYCIDKEILRNMFENLICSSINIDYVDRMHPSFAQKIQNFSEFDAKLFHIIYTDDYQKFTKLLIDYADSFEYFLRYLSNSLINLSNLGLIYASLNHEFYVTKEYTNIFVPECLYCIIVSTLFFDDQDVIQRMNKSCKYFQSNFLPLKTAGSIRENLYFVKLTPIGSNFGECCC